jgi:hypothetical protein
VPDPCGLNDVDVDVDDDDDDDVIARGKKSKKNDMCGVNTVTREIIFACSDANLAGDLNPFHLGRTAATTRKKRTSSADFDDFDDDDDGGVYDDDEDEDEDEYDDEDDDFRDNDLDYEELHRKMSSRHKSKKSKEMDDSVKLNSLWELEKKLEKALGDWDGKEGGTGGRHRLSATKKSSKNSSKKKSSSRHRRSSNAGRNDYDDLLEEFRRRANRHTSNVVKAQGHHRTAMDDNTTLTTLTGDNDGKTQDVFRPKSRYNMDELARKYGDLKIMTSLNRVNSNSDSERRQDSNHNQRAAGDGGDRGRSASPTRTGGRNSRSRTRSTSKHNNRRASSAHERSQSYANPYYQGEHAAVYESIRKKPNRWANQPSPPGMTADEMSELHETILKDEKKFRKASLSPAPTAGQTIRSSWNDAIRALTPTNFTKKADSPNKVLDAEDLYQDAYTIKKRRDLHDLKQRLSKTSRTPPTINDYLQETMTTKMERANEALRHLEQLSSHNRHSPKMYW